MPVLPTISNITVRLPLRVAMAFSLALSGCATYTPENEAIQHIDESGGYRRLTVNYEDTLGESLVLLAFSGGGTRAAALSYGVMQELRDTRLMSDGQEVRLLDEVDTISSVSGGSFTSAYYGIYRDQLFESYEEDFLRQDVQKALIRNMFNPAHWMRSASQGFDRTEMAIDYYDRTIFHDATFDDIARQGPPFIDINATDLSNGLRFTFSQDTFDLICTDLGSYPVSRAVTASSAVPVVFPTVVLKNHAGQCNLEESEKWAILQNAEPDSEAQAMLVEGLMSYSNAEERPYIHLVDGGISDNLGLRTMIDRVEGFGEERLERMLNSQISRILIILVNAETNPDREFEQRAKKPSASSTVGAYSGAQLHRYNKETLDRLRQHIEQLRSTAAEEWDESVDIYFSEVNFEDAPSEEINRFLNAMPTSLELEDVDVDRLIVAGRLLLRYDPAFTAFKQSSGARLAEDAASTQDLCDLVEAKACMDSLGGAAGD